MTAKLDQDLIGRALEDGYAVTQSPNVIRLSALRGRPRYRLKDVNFKHTVDVSIDMTSEQFSAWQSFWNGPVERGNKPFIMRLAMGSMATFNVTDEQYTVRAVSDWSAEEYGHTNWMVKLTVEIPAYVVEPPIISCDIIWAGNILALPPNDIYGGPIGSLATDIIEPCPEVLNG